RALLGIVKQYPGGIDEARARLFLALLGERTSVEARQEIALAQKLIEPLLNRTGPQPGLPSVAAMATQTTNGQVVKTTPFYASVMAYLTNRWNQVDTDAAEAGYRFAELNERD